MRYILEELLDRLYEIERVKAADEGHDGPTYANEFKSLSDRLCGVTDE